MKAKIKGRTPFLLKPYSYFDGWMLLVVFGGYFLAGIYLIITQIEVGAFVVFLIGGASMCIVLYGFRVAYKSVLIEEGKIVVKNWLGGNKTYPLNEIKGYLIQETWGAKGQLTSIIVIMTIKNERIVINREYYYDERLERLFAAFERYQIPNLGFEEMKVKNKYLYEKISLYVYFIGGLIMSTLIFLRHMRVLSH